MIYSNAPLSQKVATVLALLAAIISAFILIISTGHIWPARALMSIPFLLGRILVFAYKLATTMIRYALIFCTLVALVFNIYLNTRLFYSDFLAWQKDSQLVRQVAVRAETNFGEVLTSDPVPIVVLGKQKSDNLPAQIVFETFGQSLFSWDDINYQRIIPVFQINQIFYFKAPDQNQISIIRDIGEEMDIWPGKNALIYDNGVVILKLGE